MLGTYNYDQIIRKTVIGFGTLFNNLEIRRYNDDNTTYQRMKVPLAYGPRSKFLARLTEQPELGRPNAISLPRMSFEMNGISYDSSRKQSPINYTTTGTADATKGVKKTFVPVPYNLGFELSVITRTQEDSLQIVEQILPTFQPSFNLSIKLVEEANIIKDIPIILNNVSFVDDYDGDFSDRRTIIWTLDFQVKTYIYGPTTDVGFIKKAITREYSDTNISSPGRYRKYEVTPKAKIDKNADNVIDAIDDSLLVPGDDFGFNETASYFEDV